MERLTVFLLLQLISLSPSPVGTNDAQQFVIEFESSQRLPGQLLESQDEQVLHLDEQQASLSENALAEAEEHCQLS